ncbi:MAG: helix-turn-helix transcriptional regulator [Flavobacteriales bacterium]|nr:helix-turn-helix transcriptional regulator [Flavobacteriales bacterium]
MDREKELQKLGERIKELRKSKGMTQLDLAAAINQDYTSITRLEAGRTNPTYVTLLKIAEGLEVSVSDLLKIE